jgi:hypothetical protein
MKPETVKRLEAVLDDREKQKQAAIRKATEQEQTEARNLADFSTKKQTTIKTAFQEIVGLYKARGVNNSIREADEQPNDKGGTTPPMITLEMSEKDSSYGSMKPEFRLTFDKRNRSLSLYTSTRSMSGPAGNVPLDEITVDWIQDAFLKYAEHGW